MGQKGLIQILALGAVLAAVAGLGVGLYLAQHPTNILPKAAESGSARDNLIPNIPIQIPKFIADLIPPPPPLPSPLPSVTAIPVPTSPASANPTPSLSPTPSPQSSPTPPTTTAGQIKTAVIFVHFTDNTPIPTDAPPLPGKPALPPRNPITHARVTVDIVRNILEGSGMWGDPSVNAFYDEVTHGKIHYAFDYFGWYQTPTAPPQTCDLGNLMTLSDSLAESHGVNLTPYQARVYIFPGLSCDNHAFGGKDSSKPYSFAFLDDFLIGSVYSHELGHALNLAHAARWECQTPNDYTNNCTINERGDFYDIMGGQGYFNAPHQISLGLIQNQQIQTITQSGTYTIVPIEQETGSKTLKILKPDTRQRQCDGSGCNDYQDYYYIEYRRPIGIDSRVVFDHIGETIDKEGIEIHIWDGFISTGDVTKLVNPQDPVLHDGQSFYDAVNNIRITQVSHNADHVTLNVQMLSNLKTPSPSATPLQRDYRVSFDPDFTNLIDTGDNGVFGSGNEKTITFNLIGGYGQKSVYVQFLENGSWVPSTPIVTIPPINFVAPTPSPTPTPTPAAQVCRSVDCAAIPQGCTRSGAIPTSCNPNINPTCGRIDCPNESKAAAPPPPVCRSVDCAPIPKGCTRVGAIPTSCDDNVSPTCGKIVCP